MCLDRHGCTLQLDWLAKVYNCEAVILILEWIDSAWQNGVTQIGPKNVVEAG